MNNSLLTNTVMAGALALTLAATGAETGAQKDWTQKVKNPTDWLSWGADLRLRNEFLENMLSLNPLAAFHDQDYFRFRGRVYATVKPHAKLSLNARVTAEPRYWNIESFSAVFRNQRGMEWQEGVIDNLNLKWSEMFNLPLTLTVGRQDLMLMDGWLFMDATPLDGSRTFFYDAARLALDLKDQKTKIEAIYIEHPAMNDAWLPPIKHHEYQKAITDQDERGLMLWVNNSAIKELNLDVYGIWKHDSSPVTAAGIRGNSYTLGGRLSGQVLDNWKYRVEGAYQFGRRQEPRISPAFNSVNACGFNSQISYMIKDPWNNQLHLAYEFLSGDDPATTGTYEMFDPLWARWPRFSEGYIYSYAQEIRIAECSNFHRFGPGWTLNPTKKMDISAYYNLLWADETIPTLAGANPNFSRNGHFRGHYLQAILKYKFCKNASGHLWAEFLWPGDFYTFQERSTFLRAEVLLTF